jgi:signal peptide peptidase SppA
MSDYKNIIQAMTRTPWFMEEQSLKMIVSIINERASGVRLTSDEIALRMGNVEPRDSSVRATGAVAVLPLHGPIFPRANLMTEMSGATSLEQFRAQFDSLVKNPMISSIVLDIDSPGGSAAMVEETAQMVRSARDVKPIIACANHLCASAAYYIGAQASQFFGTDSAYVGSIGTYLVHEDQSEKNRQEGIKVTYISAGENKVDGNPDEPLSDSARQHMQQIVNEANNRFLNAVAQGRGVSIDQVRDNYGGGKVFGAETALELGMIDGIQTLDSVVGRASEGGFNAGPTQRSNIVVPSQSYDADKEHSEPGTGTGGEPIPRPQEDKDKAIEGGWRRNSPPAAFEEPEESVMDREQLQALADRLGVSYTAETTDAELSQLVTSEFDEVVGPLIDAREAGTAANDFRSQFPEQAAELDRLSSEARLNEARNFAQDFEVVENTNRGFSPRILEIVESAHLQISEGTFAASDLSNLLTNIAQAGLVPIGEHGSSRQRVSDTFSVAGASRQEIRQEFTKMIRARMDQDSLEFKAARDLVASEHPELAAAYLAS